MTNPTRKDAMEKRKLPCGCTYNVSAYGTCSKCTARLKEHIWRNMSEAQKAYDRHFDPVRLGRKL